MPPVQEAVEQKTFYPFLALSERLRTMSMSSRTLLPTTRIFRRLLRFCSRRSPFVSGASNSRPLRLSAPGPPLSNGMVAHGSGGRNGGRQYPKSLSCATIRGC